VPETAKPLNPSSRSISFTYSGFDIVMPWPTALFSLIGAITFTSPNSLATSQSANIPDE
jgi:hypothetical protein